MNRLTPFNSIFCLHGSSPPARKLELREDEVHIWLLPLEKDSAFFPTEPFETFLTNEEKARTARFLFPKDQQRSFATRVLVRLLLSSYTSLAPESWEFQNNPYGRPEISEVCHYNGSPLFFNLAHSKRCIGIAFSRIREVGLDIEWMRDSVQAIEVAEKMFSQSEYRNLCQVPQEELLNSFYRYWTLKEAYIKARGMGLSLPLDQFSFSINSSQVLISFDPQMNEEPSRWSFQLFSPFPGYQGAWGIRKRDPGDRIQLTVRKITGWSRNSASGFDLQSEDMFSTFAS